MKIRDIAKSAIVVLVFHSESLFAGVSINEIMQSNFGGVLDYYNEFPDSWVEIHNSGEESVDLKGYMIAEKNDKSSAYTIPNSMVVEANGYALVYCDKGNFKEHTNFRLNSDKPGAIYLWDSKGVFADSMHYPEMISPEVSWGRLPDNRDSLSHFRIATPEAANNNTNTEWVMKKVDFSVKGGSVKEPFWLYVSMKGDYPDDAVIRYTTDGTEPTENSNILQDSIYIWKNTVVRAKPFSDQAISKISKTQTYLFGVDNDMPIISMTCNPDYLYGSILGICSSFDYYYQNHRDNPSPRSYDGNQNYQYNWRRPVNVEYYSRKEDGPDFNQLAETHITGAVSRKDLKVKSMAIKSNKRFGDKHFVGTFWEDLRPDADRQKSLAIRSSSQDLNIYGLRDMFTQNSIGRFAKYFDIDFQAHRNVQFFINGVFKNYMHLQERANDDYVWANYGKKEDIEFMDVSFHFIDYDDLSDFPNCKRFLSKFRSSETSYVEMADELDVNEFMNYVSLHAFFANIDWPNNNIAYWYDKEGSKKWRFILKDLDAACIEVDLPYYKYLMREDPYRDYYFNTDAASELFIKMFSFGKFRQPYIDRVSVLASTVWSENNTNKMLDTIFSEMSSVMTAKEFKFYLGEAEFMYDWLDFRRQFHAKDLGDYFGLGDTTQLTVKGMHHDSIIYFNNNPLPENRYDGHFYEGRVIYLSHDDKLDIYGLHASGSDHISYLDIPSPVPTSDSATTNWTISYNLGNEKVVEHYANEVLRYSIPEGAKNVVMTDGYSKNGSLTSAPVVASRNPQDLTYMVYTIGGVFLGSYNYEQLQNRHQQEDVNIVVICDSLGNKIHAVKLLKE